VVLLSKLETGITLVVVVVVVVKQHLMTTG